VTVATKLHAGQRLMLDFRSGISYVRVSRLSGHFVGGDYLSDAPPDLKVADDSFRRYAEKKAAEDGLDVEDDDWTGSALFLRLIKKKK